jgi:hypothetical protein
MGDTGGLYCVRVRPRGPGHVDDNQVLGDINGEGAPLLGSKIKYAFNTDLPWVLGWSARLKAPPQLTPFGGTA